jgi:hypothetical protein
VALAGTSSFFASVVTPRRFRHVAASDLFHERRQSLDWIPLVDAGDLAALAVAQHVVTMDLDGIDSDALRLALFRSWLRMPRLSSLVLVDWEICPDTVDAISRLDNLDSLELFMCKLTESAVPHIRALRAQRILLVPCCIWEQDAPKAQAQCALASLADTAVLRVLHTPALALSARSFQGCAFPVLTEACVQFPRHSAELEQAVRAFLTSAVALETLRVCDVVGSPWDLSLPSGALGRLTHLEAPLHIFSPLAMGRPIRTLDMRADVFILPLLQDLAPLRLPGTRDVLALVEHLKVYENILLGGDILPYAGRLETLLVNVRRQDFHKVRLDGTAWGKHLAQTQIIPELVSELARASGTLRTLSIDTVCYDHHKFRFDLSVQHDIVLRCAQSTPSLSEISLGSVFRWVPERAGGSAGATAPAARGWRPRVVDKDALTKMVAGATAQKYVKDFDGFLRRLYADEIEAGALDPRQAGFE